MALFAVFAGVQACTTILGLDKRYVEKHEDIASDAAGGAAGADGFIEDVGTDSDSDSASDLDADAHPDGDVDAEDDVLSDAADASDVATDSDAAVCPAPLPGPALVRTAAGFCIDATEVTNAHYLAFLATNPFPELFPIMFDCLVNSFVPNSGPWPPPMTAANLPVVGVDWCDANAYCRWANKRLCGRVGGGDSSTLIEQNQLDQWFNACTARGQRAYPYGAAFSRDACNGAALGRAQTSDVASLNRCQGGYDGIFDMSGNVAEWQHSCEGFGAASCSVRGGSFKTALESELSCAASRRLPTKTWENDIGFRCCRD